jgi:hypothetical protein
MRSPKPRPQTRPRCYHYCGKVARPGSRFCSLRCAADFAEGMVEGNGDSWCPQCREWRHDNDDRHTCADPGEVKP